MVSSPPCRLHPPSLRASSPEPFHLLSVCASFRQYLPITNTAIAHTHAAPAHRGFLSGASRGCLSRLSKSSPASPFLCGRRPTSQRYFPESPHCTTCGTAPQLCFLSEIPRHRGMGGMGSTSGKVLCCYCPADTFPVVYDVDSQSSFIPQLSCHFLQEAFSDYNPGPQLKEFSSSKT